MNLIKNKQDLFKIKSTEDYELMCDIDLENEEIEYLIDDFRGNLNGNGYCIKNIVIKKEIITDEQPVALINSMFRASLKNLNIKNLQINVKNNGYTPSISLLCDTCENSVIDNVSIESIKKNIPFIMKENKNSFSNIIVNNKKIC